MNRTRFTPGYAECPVELGANPFIDLAFELGGVEGLDAPSVKRYIRFIADRRLVQLGLEPFYRVERNPLPWLDEILSAVEHTNFFENRATEYSKASTSGTWEEAFAKEVFSSADNRVLS